MTLSTTNKDAKLIPNAIYLFLNRFFINVASLLVMYFFSHQLSTVDYGQYQSFWIQLNIFNALAGIGFSAFAVIYPPEKIVALFHLIRKNNYLKYGIYLILISILFSALQFDKNVNWIYAFLFIIAFALNNIGDTFLIVFRKLRLMVAINIVFSIGFFLIHYLLLDANFNLNNLIFFLLGLLFSKLILILFIVYTTFKTVPPSEIKDSVALEKMWNLWRQLFYYDVIQISSLWLDKFIVSLTLSPEEIGLYTNGTYPIPFIPILLAALTSGALIQLSSAGNAVSSQVKTVHQVSKILSSIVLPLALFFLFFTQEFILFFFSDKYIEAVPIFRVAVLILFFRAYSHTLLLQKNEQGKIINQGAVMDIFIAFLLIYPLYKIFGLVGIAACVIISTFIQSAYYLAKTASILQVQWWSLLPWKNWLYKLGLFTLLAFLLSLNFFNIQNTFYLLCLSGGIMATGSLVVLGIEMKLQSNAVRNTASGD